MQYLDNKNNVLDLLAEGAVVITPNNRLSAALLKDYFIYHKGNTQNKPSCMPYGTAIKHSFRQFQFQHAKQSHLTLLNTEQCHHLWQKIIKTDSTISYSEGLLQAMIEAWMHCQLWLINPEDRAFEHNLQTQQFQKLWQRFNRELHNLECISEPQLIPYLLQTNTPLFTTPLVWACFDEFTPQQFKLQTYLKDKAQPQYQYDLKENNITPAVLAAADSQEEYQQLIAWLQLQLTSLQTTHQAKPIGVVVPELQNQSTTLKRLLLNHLDSSLFDISLGEALGNYPIIAHALCWLRLSPQKLTPQQMTLLLQSPYLGHAHDEFLQRSHYLQNSELVQRNNLSLQELQHDLKKAVPKLAILLSQFKAYPPQAPPQEWVEIFQDRLNSLGFPGDYGLNSENYQCHNRLKGLFDEFRQLSLISPQLTTEEALDAFTHLVHNTIFQTQKAKAPIQISGLLEASGCEFHSVWVTGLTSQCLPQKTRLSAFIPPTLQRELLMPHSLPTRELQFAKQTLERLQKGSPHCVFSYPSFTGDNPNLPSPLIASYPCYNPLPIALSTPPNSLIHYEESYQVPLKADEVFGGGTALLANQAKCPFKAFADHRLKAKPSPVSSDGLNPMERGQLLHRVMELLWRELKSQKHLLALPTSTLDKIIHQAIDGALAPLSQKQEAPLHPLLQHVEYTRLKRLVVSCLESEKQRPPFEIDKLEQAYTIQLAGLDFKVRVDRLDKNADKKWVIDYKSTLPAAKPWNEDRPREPQLLLYALLDEDINALVFVQLKAGQVLFSGLSEESQDISGIGTIKKDQNWSDLKKTWFNQLTCLAEEFQQGFCLPKPIDTSICQQCDFQNLCRIQRG